MCPPLLHCPPRLLLLLSWHDFFEDSFSRLLSSSDWRLPRRSALSIRLLDFSSWYLALTESCFWFGCPMWSTSGSLCGRSLGSTPLWCVRGVGSSAAIAKETLNNVSWKVYVRKIGAGSLAISARQKKGFTTYYTTTFPATATVYVEGILFSSTAVSQFLMNNWNTWLRTGAFNTTLYDVSVDGANFTSYLHETRRLHQNLVAGVTSSGVLSGDTLSSRRMSAMDAGCWLLMGP